MWEGTYDTETPETLAIFDEEFSKVEGFDVDLMLDGWPTKVVQKVQARGRIRTEDEARACIAFRDFFGEEALGDPEFWVMLDDYLVA